MAKFEFEAHVTSEAAAGQLLSCLEAFCAEPFLIHRMAPYEMRMWNHGDDNVRREFKGSLTYDLIARMARRSKTKLLLMGPAREVICLLHRYEQEVAVLQIPDGVKLNFNSEAS